MAVEYFLIVNRQNLARVVDGVEFTYLDHETGAWVADVAAFDQVNFEGTTRQVTLTQAKKWLKAAVPTIEPLWLEEVEA